MGATMAIFGVVNAVLLRPLPYQDPGKLVYVWEDMRNRSVTDFPWPPADFADLRAQASRFESVAALTTGRQVFVGPTDLATFATMIVCFIILAIIACGVPAARAARLDPMVALRGE